MQSNVDKGAVVCKSVGGQSCNILLDIGAMQTVVTEGLIDPNSFTEKHKVARGFKSIHQSFPLARTSIRVDGGEHNSEVLVTNDF